ncbi:hypothetical protein K490DRAFT_45108 [Saccharata proteae CBS 121410]|uniref:Uncharacterized protein n=1 Tax=Saccharata proteae CBS 121410 TaxID=1314787 RepID=A0A9P4LXF3_9PEZI|nr:hypothetical protein K490DRAFT_45108 [Saccharata proteae CBS 121410]
MDQVRHWSSILWEDHCILHTLMKRITHYPRAFLGVTLVWPIVQPCSMMDVDPFSDEHRVPAGFLLLANALWTVIYDTVYAHQDLENNVKAGINSTAVLFQCLTKLLATVLKTVMVLLLVYTGELKGFTWAFFTDLGVTATALALMLMSVDLDKPSSSAWFFCWGFWCDGKVCYFM